MPLPLDNAQVAAQQMKTILVVEDEEVVRDVVVQYLQREGFRTIEAADGYAAKELIEAHANELSLVVLDLMLPGIDGIELCRIIRKAGDLPIVMLTAKADQTDRIIGLELGADDYLGKPFSPRELIARIRAILRRAEVGPGEHSGSSAAVDRTVSFDGLLVDPVARRAEVFGQAVALTTREFDLLHFMAANPNEVFSRDQLLARVWGFGDGFDPGTVSVHIRRLRTKLEENPEQPQLIKTVWGSGYLFQPPSESERP